MDEHALRELIFQVRSGRLSRRAFVQTMVGLGLTAPLAGEVAVPSRLSGGRRPPC